MKKLVALILTLMLILSFATVSFAASTKGTAVAGTSKSKTATALNPSTWTSDVTLSLPSAEEKLETDVVFVLDGSSSADTDVVRASLSLLNALKTAAGDSGAAVNVCVVKFKRRAFKSAWFDLATNFEAIKAALEDKYSGGTNIHAGLLAGKEALEEHQNIPSNKNTWFWFRTVPPICTARMGIGQATCRLPVLIIPRKIIMVLPAVIGIMDIMSRITILRSMLRVPKTHLM